MSRQSEYTQADIERRTDVAGFDYIRGQHANGFSEHEVRCRRCGGKQIKRSRHLVGVARCIFQPCNSKGRLTLAHLSEWAADNEMSLCFAPTTVDLPSATVERTDILVWVKNGRRMTKSWASVFDRVRNEQHPYFLPDENRTYARRHPIRVRAHIKGLDDAINFLELQKVKKWGVATKKYPDFCALVIELKLKNALFEHYGWKQRIEYSEFTDDQLISYAVDIYLQGADAYGDNYSTSRFEDENSGVISRIRRLELVAEFYQEIGVIKKTSWKKFTFEEARNLILSRKIKGSTELHNTMSGLYKFLASKNWLDDLSVEFGWGGNYPDVSGRKWLTRGEAYLASLLLDAGEPFEAHPRLPFRGFFGGQRFGDFYLPNRNLWVEVWGFFAEADDAKNYAANREHKEMQYCEENLPLCSIEGRILYRRTNADEVSYGTGKENFIAHCRTRLGKYDIIV